MIWAICGETKDGATYLIKHIIGGDKEHAEAQAEKLTDDEKRNYVKVFVEETEQF
jgi:hypothetical protein